MKNKNETKNKTALSSAEEDQTLARVVKCPTCKKMVPFISTNPYRPFCSERCKMTDLGTWADENYRIPAEKLELPETQDPTQTDDEHE